MWYKKRNKKKNEVEGNERVDYAVMLIASLFQKKKKKEMKERMKCMENFIYGK